MILPQAAVLALALINGAPAQTPADAPPPPCRAAESAQMDFWLGEWVADYGEGTPGLNRVTKVLDDCVVQEEFEGGPAAGGLIGRSYSMYHAGLGQWRQTWVDNQGGYFALVGGMEGDDFVLRNTRVVETAPYLRMVYQDIRPNSFTWRWQQSADAGATWSDKWVIRYTRRAPE